MLTPDQTAPSLLVPSQYWKSTMDARLMDLVMQAIPLASQVNHDDLCAKIKSEPHWPNVWPGEPYKLLTAIVQVLNPKVVIDIGTFTGMSALAMKGPKVYTFDVIPWNEFDQTVLTEEDFDNNLIQIVDDLSIESVFNNHAELLKTADLIYIDAMKDGKQEQAFIDNFKKLTFDNPPIFIFDDIKLMNMIDVWNDIDKPKLDLTSFGHWSGTGIINWI